MVVEAWTRHEKRAPRVQHLQVERWDRAARLTEERHEAARPKAVEALVERAGADTVVDHMHSCPTGYALDLGLEILRGVVDDVIGPGVLRQFRLPIARHRPDHRCPA